jgi:hypothetical protein
MSIKDAEERFSKTLPGKSLSQTYITLINNHTRSIIDRAKECDYMAVSNQMAAIHLLDNNLMGIVDMMESDRMITESEKEIIHDGLSLLTLEIYDETAKALNEYCGCSLK